MLIKPRAEFVPFLEAFPGFSFPSAEAVVGTRAFLATMPPPPMPDPSKVAMSSEVIPAGEGGEADLRLFWVRPAGEEKIKGTVIAFHGGGFLVGVPEMEIPLLTRYAEAGFNVLSVDYRLAPEHVFPAAYDDAERAWDYLTSGPGVKKFGIDPKVVALYGSSAGSALAAGLARRILKKGGEQPKIVACDSMFADDRADLYAQSREGDENTKNHVWKRVNMLECSKLAFNGQDAALDVASLRSTSKEDFIGLPPHYISSCEIDALAEHGPAFAAKLAEAGVGVELHLWRGAPHAFGTLVPQAKLSGLLFDELVRVIGDAFDEE